MLPCSSVLFVALNIPAVLCPPSMSIHLSDNSLESVLVPLDGLDLVDTVAGTDSAPATPTLGNALTRPGHAAVEVHAVNTTQG
jgi:hypothetical protein